MLNQRRDVWTFITIGIFVFYFIFMVYPLFALLRQSVINEETGALTFEFFAKFFSRQYYYGAVFNSIKVTVAVTLMTIVVAMPLAYILTTFKVRGASAVRILILVSSMSAPFIGAYSWILLMGRNGAITNFVSDLFGFKMPSIYGFGGIVLVLTLQFTPLVFMYISGALKSVDNSLLEASEGMGCSNISKITKVVMPLITPTILAGALLVFMRALADFGTPMLLGEGYRTVPVLIFNEFISEMGGNDSFASAISVLVVIFATAVFLAQKFVSKRMAFAMSALKPIESKQAKGFKNIAAHAYVYLYVCLAMLPQLCIIYTSFQKTAGLTFAPGYSLDSYRMAFGRLGSSITNTFLFALIAIAVIVLVAVLISYVTVRRPNAVTNTLDTFTMFPYLVPGSILGIALLVTFNKAPLVLSGTAAIIIVAFVIKRLPYTIRSSTAVLHQVNPSVEEAAISLGASQMKTFFKITVPMILSGVIAGAILSWITILTELSSSILLYSAGTKTMAIETYTQVIRGNYGVAAALSTIMSVATVISLLIFFKVSGKDEITL
ncbi:MAG: iron ABC transporter permease [Deferribacteraceae bacterium]|nr:iron ABC transporter permease [Deferribacteraceae bacterium]